MYLHHFPFCFLSTIDWIIMWSVEKLHFINKFMYYRFMVVATHEVVK